MKTIPNRRFYRNGFIAWVVLMVFAVIEGFIRAGPALSVDEKG